jgi:hypothetical protein
MARIEQITLETPDANRQYGLHTGFTKLGSYYYMAYRSAAEACVVVKMSDSKGTGATTVLTVADYGGAVSFYSNALVNIDDTLYLACSKNGTGVKLYHSANGTDWTLDQTIILAKTLFGADIFKLNTTIYAVFWQYNGGVEEILRVYDWAANTWTQDTLALTGLPTSGSVVANKYYYILKIASDNFDLYYFDGANFTKAEDMTITGYAVNCYLYNSKYYENGDVKVVLLPRYIVYWDKQLAAWKDLDISSATTFIGIVKTAWNTIKYFGAGDIVYEIIPAGMVVKRFTDTTYTNHWHAGWDTYWQVEDGDHAGTYYAASITKTQLSMQSGTVTYPNIERGSAIL